MGEYLKKYLKKRIEDILNNFAKGNDDKKLQEVVRKQVGKVKVVEIQFAYENHQLIADLKKRGKAITDQKWEEVENLNDIINDKCQENYDKLT